MIKVVIIFSLVVASYFISFSDSSMLRYIVYGATAIGLGVVLFLVLRTNSSRLDN